MVTGLKHKGAYLKNLSESYSLSGTSNIEIEQEFILEKVISNSNQVGMKK